MVEAASPRRIALPASLDIGSAGELRRRLVEAVADARPVVFDAGLVERVDTAGVQVLIAAVRALREEDRRPAWAHVGPAMREGIRLLGAAHELGLDTVAESAR